MTFDAEIGRWHDFYVTVGAASATLAGLLFVGLALHLSIVVSHAEIRQLARVTLTDFLGLLLIALFALIPASNAWQLGLELVPSAVGAMAFVGRAAIEARRTPAPQVRRSLLLGRFGLSGAAFAVQAGTGVLFFAGAITLGLGLLVGVVLLLLVVAVRNAWDLLVTVAENRGATAPTAG
jgi:hypothetical protein